LQQEAKGPNEQQKRGYAFHFVTYVVDVVKYSAWSAAELFPRFTPAQ
jgi:hypothetical protein